MLVGVMVQQIIFRPLPLTFASTVPGHRDDAKQRQNGSLEETQEESVDNKSRLAASDVNIRHCYSKQRSPAYTLCRSGQTTHEGSPAEDKGAVQDAISNQ